jgi:PKD repeat protein
VDAANVGDTIQVDGGTITGTGIYYENVIVDKTLNIVGEDSSTTTVVAWNPTDWECAFSLIANNIKISGFTVSSSDIGFEIFYANYCEISDNIVVSNNDGIFIRLESNYNLVTGNTITDNEYGIRCGHTNSPYSSYNVITKNDITSNEVGVEINGWNNEIYHNNFIGNSNHALCYKSSIWDDGYPSGGNYWDDYSGVDLFSGPNQDISGADRIGDTPYLIYTNNQDHYPFMEPNAWLNQLPVANAGSGQTVLIGEIVQFDGSSSSDPDGTITSYDWDFGDTNVGTGVSPTHSYNAEGTYTVTLTVMDDYGATDSDTVTITVITPEQATQNLITEVESLGLDAGIENSFVSKLQNAINSISNDRPSAEFQLGAFINEVNAQRGVSLTDTQADMLIGYAQWIIDNF